MISTWGAKLHREAIFGFFRKVMILPMLVLVLAGQYLAKEGNWQSITSMSLSKKDSQVARFWPKWQVVSQWVIACLI